MELYQIILAISGGIIAVLLAVIGYFLDSLIKETKQANKDLSKKIDFVQTSLNGKIDLVQASVTDIKLKVSLQDGINKELKQKDDEIWAELKQMLIQINLLSDKYSKHSEELSEAVEAIKKIMLSHINNDLLHREQPK